MEKELSMHFLSSLGRAVLAATSLIVLGATPAVSMAQSAAESEADRTSLSVPIYKTLTVQISPDVRRISVGNPDIADVLILKTNALYVLGKDLGTTNVMMWDRRGELVSSMSVEVTHDLDGLKRHLARVLSGEPIEVYSVQRNVVLAGQVSSIARMDAAIKLAEGYLEQAATAKDKIFFEQQTSMGGGGGNDRKSGEVINLMTVGGAQQVMLQVKVAELQRTIARKLDAQLATLANTGNWALGGGSSGVTFPGSTIPVFANGSGVGPIFDGLIPSDQGFSSSGIFASFVSNEFAANLALDIAKENGLGRILAEPTLTALTGQEAQFLSGGSFPIPVTSEDGIGVDFRDFGVKLSFVPVVLGNGRINLKLNISVSELLPTNSLLVSAGGSSGSANSVFAVPALTERRALSTVELSDGQTIGIAGLSNESMRESIRKFPGLGDIPVLGQLFRSQAFQKGETELVILVTPRLAKPMRQSEIRLPTDGVNLDRGDAAFYWGVGSARGSEPAPTSAQPAPGTPMVQEAPAVAEPSMAPEAAADSWAVPAEPTTMRDPVDQAAGEGGGAVGGFGHVTRPQGLEGAF
ncbi:MAG: type II and III secretion system protein family protein [Steroidobacteraceae bacterium]